MVTRRIRSKKPEPGPLLITPAIAWFAEDRLSITIELSRLVFCSVLDADSSERAFLHSSIADRPFNLSFVLANGIEVGVTALECGLLRGDMGGDDH